MYCVHTEIGANNMKTLQPKIKVAAFLYINSTPFLFNLHGQRNFPAKKHTISIAKPRFENSTNIALV